MHSYDRLQLGASVSASVRACLLACLVCSQQHLQLQLAQKHQTNTESRLWAVLSVHVSRPVEARQIWVSLAPVGRQAGRQAGGQLARWNLASRLFWLAKRALTGVPLFAKCLPHSLQGPTHLLFFLSDRRGPCFPCVNAIF